MRGTQTRLAACYQTTNALREDTRRMSTRGVFVFGERQRVVV